MYALNCGVIGIIPEKVRYANKEATTKLIPYQMEMNHTHPGLFFVAGPPFLAPRS
jgi:hypothetical protein